MSVPYLLNSAAGHVPASERIPVIARPFVSERAKKTLDLVSSANPVIYFLFFLYRYTRDGGRALDTVLDQNV